MPRAASATAAVFSRRRLLLAAAGSSLLARGEVRPSERVRYVDPGTEFEVFRVTNPKHASFLPPATNRVFPRRGAFLLYASDRGGSLQAYTLDLKKWESTAITEAAALDAASLTLSPDDRSVIYFDAGALHLVAAGGGGHRELYRFPESAVTVGQPVRVAVTADGPSVLFAEGGTVLRMLPLAGAGGRGAAAGLRKVAENRDGVDAPLVRPRRASVLYRSKESYWLANLDGQRQARLKTAADGKLGPALWSPDGRIVFYLHYPEDGRSHTIREHNPDTGEDKLLGRTSQFVAFSANRDASVFVGASLSKAGPYVLLMLRSVKRELAICEHKAADPRAVAPVFSPDSQKVFFQSDRHGKPAIYSMVVDRLVEKTEEEELQLERERNSQTSR